VVLRGAIATEVAGNEIRTIDGQKAVDVLAQNGLPTDLAILDFPVLARYGNGLTLARTPHSISPEGGLLLASGSVPTGAKLEFLQMRLPKVLESTSQVAKRAMKEAPGKSLLIYSCAARDWYCSARNASEYSMLQEEIPSTVHFSMGCSGGELYPYPVEGGFLNTLHNNSIIVCAL
jgi:hypothetical protein